MRLLLMLRRYAAFAIDGAKDMRLLRYCCYATRHMRYCADADYALMLLLRYT